MKQGLTVRIRHASHFDLDRIAEIEKLSFKREAYPKSLLSYLIHFGFTLVAEVDNVVAGYAAYTISDRRAHILSLAVHPALRRRGIGESLLKALLDEVKQFKIKTVELEVKANNVAALNLYSKLGFKIKSKLKRYYQGEDGYLMILSL